MKINNQKEEQKPGIHLEKQASIYFGFIFFSFIILRLLYCYLPNAPMKILIEIPILADYTSAMAFNTILHLISQMGKLRHGTID